MITAALPSIGKQLSIPELKAHLSHSHIAVGFAGELLAARALELSGYAVSIRHERGDLNVINPDGQIIGVEVKTARRNTQGAYAFTLYKHYEGRLRADARRADVVILLCLMKTGDAYPFVLPVGAIGNRHAVAVCNYPWQYNGWMAPYRQTLTKLHLPDMEV